MAFSPNEPLPDPLQVQLVPGQPMPEAWARWFKAIDRVRGAFNSTSDLTAAVAGKQTIWVPAGAMTPRVTNGPSVGATENAYVIQNNGLDFDPNTAEYAQFIVAMPKSWDKGAISARFYWTHPATTTNFSVLWYLDGQSIGDAESLDFTWTGGSAAVAGDVGGAANTLYISGGSSDLIVGGTPATEELIYFIVYRGAGNATYDTLAVDARLLGVRLLYTTNALNDT